MKPKHVHPKTPKPQILSSMFKTSTLSSGAGDIRGQDNLPPAVEHFSLGLATSERREKGLRSCGGGLKVRSQEASVLGSLAGILKSKVWRSGDCGLQVQKLRLAALFQAWAVPEGG